MVSLLVLKERLRNIYSKYDVYILSVLKFILAFFVLSRINSNIGYLTKIKNPLIAAILALVCAFLPAGSISFVMCAVILLHFSAVSLELTLASGGIFLIMFCLYFIFKTGDGFLMALTVLLCFYNIPGALVIAVGLAATPLSVIPVSFGLIAYNFIVFVKKDFSVVFSQTSTLNTLKRFTYCIDAVVKNEALLLLIFAMVLSVIVVFLIRRLSVNNAWSIAIATGGVIYLFIILIGNFAFDINIDIVYTIISTLLSMIVGVVLYFFVFAVDYSRVEYTQFEDDDYYYYVKAVPKISVTKPDVKVKRINARKSEPFGPDKFEQL